MEFARPLMWNVPRWAELALYGLSLLVVLGLAAALWRRGRRWAWGAAEPGGGWRARLWANLRDSSRLKSVLSAALFQSRLGDDRYALVMHLAIFWGMTVLFLGTAIATIDQDVAHLLFGVQVLRGGAYQLYELALDLFGVVLLVGLALAAYRRYVVRPERLAPPAEPVSRWDGFPLLGVLALVAATGFLAEGLRLAEGRQWEAALAAAADPAARRETLERLGAAERLHLLGAAGRAAELQRMADQARVFPAARWAPVGYGLSALLAPLSPRVLHIAHQVVWWLHALAAFGFLLALPLTKTFHVLASPLNLLLRDPQAPPGRLVVVAEGGAASLGDWTWRQLLQLDACVWCGRCHEACPARAGGFPLSPRDVVQRLEGRFVRARDANGDGAELAGEAVAAEALWSCCACRACEARCPVGVEQPRLIVDLRRRLVDRGQIDEGLQDALMNLQRYGNSFGQSPRKRAGWAAELSPPLKDARKEPVEYLWFVGDYASYDQRVQPATRALARLLQLAGVDAGLLMHEERNAGNDVRRVGEEGLFELLREKNLRALSKASFRAVLTTDPHTYNTLKHEYGADGGDDSPLAARPVLHYTELLDQLLAAGRLAVARPLAATVTYHDPCYLGRYNGVYDAPRRVLQALGVRLVETPRRRENSFCCGAGGGRIWMKDAPGAGERPAELRIKEVLELPGVERLVTACPKDLVMFQDAVKTAGAEGRLEVVDLAELTLQAVEREAPVEAKS